MNLRPPGYEPEGSSSLRGHRAAKTNEEPEELAAMRAMSPEAGRILLRQMNEAEEAERAQA